MTICEFIKSLYKRKSRKKEIWPIRCTNDSVIYVDLENCDQKGLAEEILKTAFSSYNG